MVISGGRLAIGIDIEHVDRFASLDYATHRSFFDRLFTEKERAYCLSQSNPAEHFAVRFAAKEAVLKAGASADIPMGAVDYTSIEVIRGEFGSPTVIIHDPVHTTCQIDISLSHSGGTAVACALLFRPSL